MLSVLRYQLLLLASHQGTPATALALLAIVLAVFALVLLIASFLGIVAAQTRAPGLCRHGRPLGASGKNACPQCAMESGAADEIRARFHPNRAPPGNP